MYQISAKGPRAAIEPAWDALAWTDPSPAGAVDAKEDGRHAWRLDAYAESEEDAEAKDGVFLRTLYMSRLPERTGPLWLQPLLRLNCEWRLNIYAHKLDKEIFRKKLQRKQAQATANTYQSILGQRSTPNQEEAEKAQEAANIGSELYTTNIEVFNYAVYFTLFGNTLDELNRATELVRTAAPQCRGARFVVGYREQRSLFVGSLPALGLDVSRRGKAVRTPTVRNSFPFVHAHLGSAEGGNWLGFSKETLEPVFLNPYDEKLPNSLCVVFGQPGEGKSMVAQQIIQMKLIGGANGAGSTWINFANFAFVTRFRNPTLFMYSLVIFAAATRGSRSLSK